MTSTSVTTVGGVVIVTQVIPKDDLSIPLETPGVPAAQAPQPVVRTPPQTSRKDSKESIFLRGEPLGLGVVQIFIGLLCVLFSLLIFTSKALILYAPFSVGGLFVVSGSLALASGRRTSVRLVWVSLASNVFSALLGLVGVTYACWLLATGPPSKRFCNFQTSNVDFQTTDSAVNNWRQRCPQDMWRLDELLYGLQGVFLVLLVLQVCVSVAVCFFSGKIIRSSRLYSRIMEDDDCSENGRQSKSP